MSTLLAGSCLLCERLGWAGWGEKENARQEKVAEGDREGEGWRGVEAEVREEGGRSSDQLMGRCGRLWKRGRRCWLLAGRIESDSDSDEEEERSEKRPDSELVGHVPQHPTRLSLSLLLLLKNNKHLYITMSSPLLSS